MTGQRLMQVYHDFGSQRYRAEEYFPRGARAEALKAARHVNGVSAALMPLVSPRARWDVANEYAAAVAGVDVATDHHGLTLSDGLMGRALLGEAELDCLEPVGEVNRMAGGGGFETAMHGLAKAQDLSIEQKTRTGDGFLRRVTGMKGGYAFNAHAYVLADGLDEELHEWSMNTGFVMQLLDDYLDQPEDEEDGINTLFTEGYWDSERLAGTIDVVADETVKVFGDTRAVRRFVRMLRLHYRVGKVENRWPGVVGKLLPWYF